MRGAAGAEGQIAGDHIDDHGHENTNGGDPEERAVMDPLPMRPRRWVGATVLLKFGMIHDN